VNAPAADSEALFDYSRRLRWLRKALSESEFHALLITCPENVYYLSGFHDSYITGFHGSSGVLLITHKQQMLFSDFRYRLQAAQQAPKFRFIEVSNNPIIGAARYAREKGLEAAGVEAHHITVQELERLRRASRGVRWRPAGEMVERLRQIKEPEEIAEIRRAAKIGDAVLKHMLSCLAPGKSEHEIALEGETFILKSGAKGAAFDIIVAAGLNSALPHAQAGRRIIRKGDLVVFDLGVRMASGYCSDLTRTAAVGRSSAWQREIYSLVYEAQAKGLAALRAGAIAREVDAAARVVIEAAGHGANFGHGLGHGLGLAAHEEPRLSRRNRRPLAAGMVVTVEPGIYLAGRGGVRIEDLVVITKKGCELLSRAPKPAELPVV
jgi:Xaa-Pro aminopeptidase